MQNFTLDFGIGSHCIALHWSGKGFLQKNKKNRVVAISGRVGGTRYSVFVFMFVFYLCVYLYLYLSLTLDLGSGGQWLVRWQGGAGPSFDTACEFTAS